MEPKFQPLFESFKFRSGVEVKNRVVMAPMTNFSSNPDGTVTDDEVAYYARRSDGVGMVVTACTNVTLNGKGFPGEFGAFSDEMIPSLRQLGSGIQEQGAKAVLQIFHGGRMCPPNLVPNGDVVSASAVAAEQDGAATPRELTADEIKEIIEAFGETTRRAIEAGYDGVEIHGANGYLIQQFFSPHSNRRTDEWGGDLEKRMAFPLAIVREVLRVRDLYAKKPFLVGYRFSPEEPTTPGITMQETLELVNALADENLDYLHVSLMDFWSVARRGAGDEAVTRIELLLKTIADRVPLIGVGQIRTPDDALRALETGVPLIALGREIIIDPDWVQKIERGAIDEIATELSKDDQEKLVVPTPLWQAIVNTPGWFPGI